MNSPYVDPRSKFKSFGVDAKSCSDWIRAYCTIGDNVTNKKVRFKHRIQGVVKKFNDYVFFSKGYVPYVSKRKFDFSKVRLSSYLKGTNMSNYKNKGLPLPITSVSKIVSVFKGGLPFKVDKRDYLPDNHVWKCISDIDYDKQLIDNKRIFPGSWEYSNQNLIDMATPKTKFYHSGELIDGVFSRVGIDFKLPYVKYWNINVINGILTKPKAFPGLLTSKLFGHNRLLTTGFSKTFAKHYFLFIIKRFKQVFDLSLITVGGREKRVTFSDDFKILKTRIVLMMEDIPTILGQSVAVVLTKAFQRMNDGYNFVGRSLEQRNYVNIVDSLTIDPKTTIVFNADFSGHDNHVDEHQIVTAFAILRLCFPVQWKFMDKLFLYFLSGMLVKHIVIPGSQFIYRITKGIATGNPFTSLVNTTVAYMTFATAIHKVATYSEICDTRLYVAGDDVIGVIPLSILEKLSDELSNNSGMKIDPISDHCGPLYSNDPMFQRSFLKKKFTLMGPAWNDYELLDNLYTSAGGIRNTSHEITRIIDSLMNGPCDFILNYRVRRIIEYHLSNPRYKGLSYNAYYEILQHAPPWKRVKTKLTRPLSNIFTDNYKKYVLSFFERRMTLAFRWFNVGQPFPALGYKDDSYWIDATKVIVPCKYVPHRTKLHKVLYKHFSIKWHCYNHVSNSIRRRNDIVYYVNYVLYPLLLIPGASRTHYLE